MHALMSPLIVKGSNTLFSHFLVTGNITSQGQQQDGAPKAFRKVSFGPESQLVRVWPSSSRLSSFGRPKRLCKHFRRYSPPPVSHSGRYPQPTFPAPALYMTNLRKYGYRSFGFGIDTFGTLPKAFSLRSWPADEIPDRAPQIDLKR